MRAKTKEKQNKPFYKKWWFWIIIGLILCGNIAVLIWVQNTDLKANLLTLISGWVSFIATLLIGVIAFRQSKDYKEENDRAIEKQYSFEKFKILAEDCRNYITELRHHFDEFRREFYYKIAISYFNEIIRLKNPQFTNIEEINLQRKLSEFYELFKERCAFLSEFLKRNILNSALQEKVLQDLESYKKSLFINDFINFESQNSATVNMINNQAFSAWNNLINYMEKHFVCLEQELYNLICKQSNDVNIIMNYYKKYDKEQDNGQVENG